MRSRRLESRNVGGVARRQNEFDRRALILLARDAKFTAGLFGQTVHHRKTQSGAFADALGGEERLRRARKCFCVHAFTVIGDGQAKICAARQSRRIVAVGLQRASGNPDIAAVRHRVARVDGQVDDHAAFPSWLASARTGGSVSGKSTLRTISGPSDRSSKSIMPLIRSLSESVSMFNC